MRDENDEPIYTYKEKYMRWFVRQSKKGGCVCAFNQYYKSKNCDEVLKTISEELNVKGSVCDKIEAYMKYKKHHEEIIKKAYESEFNDYRIIDEEEMNNYINEKLSEFPIHKLLQELNINDLLWDFDAVSLYPSAKSGPKPFYLRMETGYAYTQDMNDELVEKFNIQTFRQGSAVLKKKYYNPRDLIVQHLPVKEKEKKIEINRMRNG